MKRINADTAKTARSIAIENDNHTAKRRYTFRLHGRCPLYHINDNQDWYRGLWCS